MYIPEGFTTVTPYIFAKDAEAFATFLKQAFDAQEINRTMRPDGLIGNLHYERRHIDAHDQRGERKLSADAVLLLHLRRRRRCLHGTCDRGRR